MKPLTVKILSYLAGLGILLMLSFIFLAPQLSGKVIIQTDGVQGSGMIEEAKKYHEKTGKLTFWTNSMFSGMPTYLLYGGAKPGLINYINSALGLTRDDTLGYFLIFAVSVYLGFIFFGFGPWLSLLGAIAAAFATVHIGVLEAGHNTKLASSGFAVLTLAGTYRLFRKEYLIGALGFSLGLCLSLANNHPQMTYYFMIGVGILTVFMAVDFIKKKEFLPLGKIILLLVLGTILALGANLYQVVTVRGFSADTMRGGSILTSAANRGQVKSVSESSSGGLGYDYAMQWSDGVKDLLAMVIPGAVGGSNTEKVGDNKKIADILKGRGFQPQPFLPLYWGKLIFTGSPDYLGILMVLLFVFGAFFVKGPVKWGFLTATLVLILMSLGKNFDGFNQFLFHNLPYLNKFRTPNSIHNIISCLVPVFALYTLYQVTEIQKDKKSLLPLLYKVAGGIFGFIVVFGLGGQMFFDFTATGDSRYDPQLVSVLKEARIAYMTQDSFRTILFLLAGTLVLYLFLTDRLKKQPAIWLLTAVTLVDLFGVARRYISTEDWKPRAALKNAVAMRPVDEQILQDKQLYYRVLDMSSDPFQDATGASFHKLIGGYHPAKFRRYQDIIDFYLSKGDQKVLNMLNAKYFITQNQQSQLNPAAMGNGWLIKDIQKVKSPDEEILALGSIDPAVTAVVLDQEFPGYVTSEHFTQSGSVELTQYEPNHLTYKVQADGDQFAVFSEVWYGPDKGWQAYLDGKPVNHIRVNYILRAMNVPAGSHTVEFRFVPVKVIRSIEWGFWINNLTGLLFLGLIGWYLYRNFQTMNLTEPIVENQPVTIKKRSTKPKSR